MISISISIGTNTCSISNWVSKMHLDAVFGVSFPNEQFVSPNLWVLKVIIKPGRKPFLQQSTNITSGRYQVISSFV